MWKLLSLFRLPPEERQMFFRCLGVVAIVRLGLTAASYKRVSRRLVDPSAVAPATPRELRMVARGVARAARFVPKASCLTQALAGQILLARLGKASKIRLGIDRTSPERIEAHAWLMSGSEIVLGGTRSSLQRYIALVDLGQRR